MTAFVCISLTALMGADDRSSLVFDKVRVGDVTYEAAAVFDVDRDGHVDIVTGEYWFAGPDFDARHFITTIKKSEDYYDDFADYPMDVNGDGYPDIVTGAWWGQKVAWRENPTGQPIEWRTHDVAQVGNVERPNFWDIDGDGYVEVAPNTPGNPQRIFRLERDADGIALGKFEMHTISEQRTGHGLGFGDINGDGRGDLVWNGGWFEAPTDPFASEWTVHAEFDLGESASVPILVHDVNKDGLNDLIVGMGHDYGLYWFAQGRGADDNRTWTRHTIESDKSQFHEMQLADLDNDGELELITGKRWRAHVGRDPGADDPIGLYYYEIADGAFERHIISYGDPGEASGTGIYMWITDIDGNGLNDILAPGKEGLYLFYNKQRGDDRQ